MRSIINMMMESLIKGCQMWQDIFYKNNIINDISNSFCICLAMLLFFWLAFVWMEIFQCQATATTSFLTLSRFQCLNKPKTVSSKQLFSNSSQYTSKLFFSDKTEDIVILLSFYMTWFVLLCWESKFCSLYIKLYCPHSVNILHNGAGRGGTLLSIFSFLLGEDIGHKQLWAFEQRHFKIFVRTIKQKCKAPDKYFFWEGGGGITVADLKF